MNALSHLKPTVLAVAVAMLGSGCGKDKPAEPTEPVSAPVSAEPAAGDEPTAGPSDETVTIAKPGEPTAEPGVDPKTAADDPKTRLRLARERGERGERPERPGRRPRPVRDGAPEDRPGRFGEPGAEPGVGTEPHGLEPGTAPIVAEGPAPREATPTPTPQPTPTLAEPTPAPAEPATPAYEIRNDAAALDAASMLPLATVTEVLGKQLAPGTPLQGIAIAAGYGSIFYAATDAKGAPKADAFGVALQAWQDATRREAEDRFRRMRLQYPNAEDVSVLLPLKAFYSYFGTIQSLTWIDPAKRMVLSMSCGDGLCNHDAMTRLAKSARERM